MRRIYKNLKLPPGVVKTAQGLFHRRTCCHCGQEFLSPSPQQESCSGCYYASRQVTPGFTRFQC